MTIQKMKPTRLVQGHGINDLNKPIRINGKDLKFYVVWKDMLKRCYSDKFQTNHRTYVGCSVCSSWLSLSTFKVWFDANYREDMELDKDILIPGNKEYGPDTCRFVPGYINNIILDGGGGDDLPLGVSLVKRYNKDGGIHLYYKGQCCDGHGKLLTKTFGTIPEARQWYITTKTRVVGQQAIRAFMAGDITEDVYQALITREW